jgi:hypothetical protein
MRFAKAGFALALVVRGVAAHNLTDYIGAAASISTVTETCTVTVTPKCPDLIPPSVRTETVTVTKDAPTLLSTVRDVLDATVTVGASISPLLRVLHATVTVGASISPLPRANDSCESATKTITKICGPRGGQTLDIDLSYGGDDDCPPVEQPTTITKEIFITKTITLVGLA